MSRPVLLIGGGGHGRVVADALLAGGTNLQGVVDPALPEGKRWHFGLPVLGDDSVLERFSPGQVMLANGVGMLPKQKAREQLFDRCRASGFSFISVIHPAAVIAADVELGEGVQLLAGVVVNSGAQLGDNTIVNTRAVIEHDVAVGAHCHVAPGAVICGHCQIGSGVFIGAGSVLIQGRHLPVGAIVPAGACVK